MSEKNCKIERIDEYRVMIPTTCKDGMLTYGIIYASEKIMSDIDESVDQVMNVAFLPGIVGPSLAMPDIHWGYGFPIGGVAATDLDSGVVSPGGVGFDINCGVRFLKSDLTIKDIKNKISDLVDKIYANVPCGVGGEGKIRVDDKELKKVMIKGAKWVVEQGMGWAEDIENAEENGTMSFASVDYITQEAIKRGKPQLGTLGSGNHFIEIQVVDEIYDEKIACVFGLKEIGQVTVMIHSGSRGFGHQVCQDSLSTMQKAIKKYNITLPDRQLACAPINSEEGQQYLVSMACAANFAWANRQAIAHWVRESFESVLGAGAHKLGLFQVYDIAHNIAKIEEHTINNKSKKLCVHRKGSTRAFGPNRKELPFKYREVGQPVIVPGDMGRYSFIMVGTQKAMDETWGSTCHGAGRVMSRNEAIKHKSGNEVREELEEKGISVKSKGRETLSEEASYAYKDVAEVVAICDGAGISKLVAKVKPLGVIKG